MTRENDIIEVAIDMSMSSPNDTPEMVFDRTAHCWAIFRAMGFASECILVGYNANGTHIVLNAQDRQFTILTGAHRVDLEAPTSSSTEPPLPEIVVALIRDLVLEAGFVMPVTMN